MDKNARSKLTFPSISVKMSHALASGKTGLNACLYNTIPWKTLPNLTSLRYPDLDDRIFDRGTSDISVVTH